MEMLPKDVLALNFKLTPKLWRAVRNQLITGALLTCFWGTSASCQVVVSPPNAGVDAAAMINAAINSLPKRGGKVTLEVGDYNTQSSINIGNGNGASIMSTQNGIVLECVTSARPGFNGVAGEPIVAPCNINYSGSGSAISVNGPINGWGLKGIGITITSGSGANGLTAVSASFGDVENFVVNNVPGIGILEFVNSGGQASYYNTWRNIQCRMSPSSSSAQCIHIGSNQSGVDNFGDSWDNVNLIPTAAGQQSLYIGSADSMTFNRLSVDPGNSNILFVYVEDPFWPASIAFFNADFGYGNYVSNYGTPAPGAAPNYLVATSTTNTGGVPNLPNMIVVPQTTTAGPMVPATPSAVASASLQK
jgi:hypothetical protein